MQFLCAAARRLNPAQTQRTSHDSNSRFAIGESSPVKLRHFFANSIRIPRLVNVFMCRRRSYKLRATRSVLRTTTAVPSRPNDSKVSSFGHCMSLHEASLMNSLSTGPDRADAPRSGHYCQPGHTRFVVPPLIGGISRNRRKFRGGGPREERVTQQIPSNARCACIIRTRERHSSRVGETEDKDKIRTLR
jgi:hypothetical protein